MKKISVSCCMVLALVMAGCAGTPKPSDENAALILTPASFSDLKGWEQDDLNDFLAAARASCARIVKKAPDASFSSDPAFGTYGAWQPACRDMLAQDLSGPGLKDFLQKNYKVVSATASGNPLGLFTGYYESTLHGSRTRHGNYQHPLLARPNDLVMVDLGEFRDALKGQRIAGRVIDGKLKPYENRAAIVGGKLPASLNHPLVWLDNPQDAFFVQVQGSGIIHLDDGGIMRVGYDGQNGHAYYTIGRELVKRGVYTKDEVSMDSIRQWMVQNPDQADELMNTNPSYVFFRELAEEDKKQTGPQGGEGVSLTAGRSLAIDHSKIPYGLPVWLDLVYNDAASTPIRRLVMAQDTGGAIRGAVRGDYFWGSGETAEKMAGPMKAKGRYYFLLPKGM